MPLFADDREDRNDFPSRAPPFLPLKESKFAFVYLRLLTFIPVYVAWPDQFCGKRGRRQVGLVAVTIQIAAPSGTLSPRAWAARALRMSAVAAARTASL